jgi:RNA polymerase sigma factor for flagellar operon FliA
MICNENAATTRISTRSDMAGSLKQNHRRALAPEEVQKLVLENLPEVRHIARRIHVRLPRHIPFEDLVHEGVLGLIGAAEKYDPAKNVQLLSYARFRIRGAILDSLRELDWGPRHLRRQARRIEEASSELAFKLGRVPSEPEVAIQLGIPLNDFQHILKDLHCLKLETSLALPEHNSKQELFAGRLSHDRQDPFEVCVRADTKRVLIAAIETLAEKEQRALTLYYFEECTMKEVGRVLNVQESRISQIITAALDRLRNRMRKDQGARA